MFRPSEHSSRDPRRARDGRGRMSIGHGQPSAPGPQRRLAKTLQPGSMRGAWLVAPMLLLALASILRLAVRGPDSRFAMCYALLLGLGVAWISMRLCLPLPQPPPCPHCKRKALVRLEPLQACGARCLHCGWRDETIDSSRLSAHTLAQAHAHGPHASASESRAAAHPREARHDLRGTTRERPPGHRPPRGPSDRRRRLR